MIVWHCSLMYFQPPFLNTLAKPATKLLVSILSITSGLTNCPFELYNWQLMLYSLQTQIKFCSLACSMEPYLMGSISLPTESAKPYLVFSEPLSSVTIFEVTNSLPNLVKSWSYIVGINTEPSRAL